jgi:antirestriction protein ArdC
MEETRTNKERLKEITDCIEQGIKELFQSDRYRQYLSVMSRFHRYSVNNTMLIYLQRPDASLVAGFEKWKNRFGRHVRKGERGITIIAPTPFKKKIEEAKLDPDTNAPLLDQNGQQIMEEREISIPMFKPVKVFDVAQTEGKPLPHLASALTGSVEQYEVFVEALQRSAPVPISFTAIPENTDGYFSLADQSITIREGMSQVQTLCAMVHEIAHSKLHNYTAQQTEPTADQDGTESTKKDRHTEEVEAESISYAVCQYYGIETGENSFGYIATWSQGKDLKELKASLETINKTASSLITDIDRNCAEVCKERGIDPKALPEQEQTPPIPRLETNMQEALFLLDKELYLHIQTCDEGYDYTLYQADTMKLQDGGQFPEESIECHAADNPMEAAYREVCVREGLEPTSTELIPLEKLEEIREANDFSAVPGQDAPQSADDPRAREQLEHYAVEESAVLLDTYPMPDDSVGMTDLEGAGYLDEDMLPVTRDRALELLEQGLSVYGIVDGGTAEMCLDSSDIDYLPADTLFSIPKDEWEESTAFDEAIRDRMDHQEERENAFLAYPGDAYAIYQVKHTEALRDLRYEPYEGLELMGRQPQRENYDLVYTRAALPENSNPDALLDILWNDFNVDRPADYHSPSMSVSDIIAIKRAGEVSFHYCDSVGFKELPGFLQPENYLKSAEMAMEDDYGMIDGIINNGPKQPTVAELEAKVNAGQSVSLLDLANAVQAERKTASKAKDARPSILDRLKQPVPKQDNKTAPHRSAEMEI